MTNRTLTIPETVRAAVRTLHREGLSYRVIGERVGVSSATVYRFLRTESLPTNHPRGKLTGPVREAIRRLHGEGLTHPQIGKKVGLHQTAVARFLAKEGLVPNYGAPGKPAAPGYRHFDWERYDARIRDLVATDMRLIQIAEELGIPAYTVRRRLKRLGLDVPKRRKGSAYFTPRGLSSLRQNCREHCATYRWRKFREAAVAAGLPGDLKPRQFLIVAALADGPMTISDISASVRVRVLTVPPTTNMPGRRGSSLLPDLCRRGLVLKHPRPETRSPALYMLTAHAMAAIIAAGTREATA